MPIAPTADFSCCPLGKVDRTQRGRIIAHKLEGQFPPHVARPELRTAYCSPLRPAGSDPLRCFRWRYRHRLWISPYRSSMRPYATARHRSNCKLRYKVLQRDILIILVEKQINRADPRRFLAFTLDQCARSGREAKAGSRYARPDCFEYLRANRTRMERSHDSGLRWHFGYGRARYIDDQIPKPSVDRIISVH